MSNQVSSSVAQNRVSVLILTKDEEINIGRCLDGVSFSDDIICYDSMSSDRTVQIASERPNVRVVQRAFDNWSAHQNWAVQNISFRYSWVLYVDADEQPDDLLKEEVQRVSSSD